VYARRRLSAVKPRAVAKSHCAHEVLLWERKGKRDRRPSDRWSDGSLALAERAGRPRAPRTIAKVRTTMSRIFRFGIKNRRGNEIDPTKLIETVKETSGEQSETGEALYTGEHKVTEKEVLIPQEAKQIVLAAKPGLYRTIIQTAMLPARA
jgi:hypothetical protein